MEPYLIGTGGMVLIIAGWLASLDVVPSPRLSLLYGLGSLLLAVYAYMLRDPVFLGLNTMAAGIAFYNLYRGVWAKPRRQSGIRTQD